MSPYARWGAIKGWVLNKNNPFYKWYGGSGITMFEEWVNDYEAFERYVESLPHYGEPGYECLSRIDKRGNYEPGNVEWTTRTRAQDNKKPKAGMLLTYNGESKTIREWSETLGTSKNTIWGRKKKGWEDAECLFGRRRRRR